MINNCKVKYLVITLIISLSCLAFIGCSKKEDKEIANNKQDTTVEENINENQKSLEDCLYVLEDDGYQLTDEGYKIIESDEEVSSERLVSAKGNHMIVKLHYDYKDGSNKEMKQFFKDEDDAVNAMVSSFLNLVAEEAEAKDGDMEYEIYVGGDLARKGNITVAEAIEYLMYGDE